MHGLQTSDFHYFDSKIHVYASFKLIWLKSVFVAELGCLNLTLLQTLNRGFLAAKPT